MTQIAAALITAVFAFCGTALTVFWGKKSADKSNEVIIYRINRLEEKVNKLCETALSYRRERRPAGTEGQFAVLRRPRRV